MNELENLKQVVLEMIQDITKLKQKCDELEAKDKEQDTYIHWRSNL